MGWLITLSILFLLAVLPLGVSVNYDSDGPLVKIIAGPLRVKVFPLPKKQKKDRTVLKIVALVAVVAILGSIGGVLLTKAIDGINKPAEDPAPQLQQEQQRQLLKAREEMEQLQQQSLERQQLLHRKQY